MSEAVAEAGRSVHCLARGQRRDLARARDSARPDRSGGARRQAVGARAAETAADRTSYIAAGRCGRRLTHIDGTRRHYPEGAGRIGDRGVVTMAEGVRGRLPGAEPRGCQPTVIASPDLSYIA